MARKLKESIYRQLQKHLDHQPVGFPRTWSGADIRLLKRLFTPEEAQLARRLTYEPTRLSGIMRQLPFPQSSQEVESMLDGMFMKGSIGCKERHGEREWFLMPLVVGMLEAQVGNLTRRFVADAGAYMRTPSFGRSFIAVQPSQMRTIPVNISIPVEQPIATYDHVRGLVDTCNGPFVVLPCICRKLKAMKQKPCKQTARAESCLAFGETAAMCLRRGMGREVTREKTLAILEGNESDGLVLQPSNTQRVEYVCSCCGCCCGMLGVQKLLPRPLDFWTCSFQATVESSACEGCGTCEDRCQVNAISFTGVDGVAEVNRNRCIGCGLCVPTCPTQALRLSNREQAPAPPEDEKSLHDAIRANKKNVVGQVLMLLKIAFSWMSDRLTFTN